MSYIRPTNMGGHYSYTSCVLWDGIDTILRGEDYEFPVRDVREHAAELFDHAINATSDVARASPEDICAYILATDVLSACTGKEYTSLDEARDELMYLAELTLRLEPGYVRSKPHEFIGLSAYFKELYNICENDTTGSRESGMPGKYFHI